MEKHVFQRGGRVYDQQCGLCNAVADAPVHQMGDIQRAEASKATTKDKDRRLAHVIVAERPSDNWHDMESRIYAALSTARKEARAAAFKEAHKAIDNMDVVITRFQKRSSDYNGWNSAIKQAHKAIEAAANDEEGAGDG